MRLAGLLAYRGDLDELRARADADDEHAALLLARPLAERGDLDRLRDVVPQVLEGAASGRLASRGVPSAASPA
jgi:hypothetical protein